MNSNWLCYPCRAFRIAETIFRPSPRNLTSYLGLAKMEQTDIGVRRVNCNSAFPILTLIPFQIANENETLEQHAQATNRRN
jgi:hypothetical protein